MVRLHSFLLRPPVEKRLWLSALSALVRFRVLVTVRSFDRLRHEPAGSHLSAEVTVDRVRWAVLSTARIVPSATCLVQALAARRLLVRAGLPAALHVGVSRRGGGIDAHAWIDSNGKLVVGDHTPRMFHEFPIEDV